MYNKVLCTLQYKMRLMSLIWGSHYIILHTAVCTSTIKSLKPLFSCWLTPAKSNWSRVQDWRSTYRKNLQGKCDTLFLVLQTELGGEPEHISFSAKSPSFPRLMRKNINAPEGIYELMKNFRVTFAQISCIIYFFL